MFFINDMCIICLALTKNIKAILSEDEDGVVIENKLKYMIAEEDLTSHYNKIKHFKDDSPKHVCNTCLKELNNVYSFKEKCQKSFTALSAYIDKRTVIPRDVSLNISTNALLFDNPVEKKPGLSMLDLIENTFQRSGNETTTNTNQNSELEIQIKQEPVDVDEDVEMENGTVFAESLKPVEEINIKEEPGLETLSMETETEADTSKQIASIDDSIQQLTSEKYTKCQLCFRSPSGKNLYRCGLCDRYFTDVRPMISHLRTHTKDKPFKCNICNKQFNRKNGLALHLERHRLHLTGERPYQCEVCDKCFIQADNLAKHKKSHLLKSFECDVCNKNFKRYGELTMHKRIHNNTRAYACSICKRTFVQNEHLKAHMTTHTKERPYQCDLCSYRAAIKSSLESHLKRIHKIKKTKNVLNVVPVQDVIRLNVVKTEADADNIK